MCARGALVDARRIPLELHVNDVVGHLKVEPGASQRRPERVRVQAPAWRSTGGKEIHNRFKQTRLASTVHGHRASTGRWQRKRVLMTRASCSHPLDASPAPSKPQTPHSTFGDAMKMSSFVYSVFTLGAAAWLSGCGAEVPTSSENDETQSAQDADGSKSSATRGGPSADQSVKSNLSAEQLGKIFKPKAPSTEPKVPTDPTTQPTEPSNGSSPTGVFKVCNTTTDGCICKATDNCTTNGITFNTQKPPTGSKKVILYFHGHNGSSSLCDSGRKNQQTQFLANMYKKGFGWICADSSDRVEKWWSVVNSSSNPDVVNLEQILEKEGYDSTAQIYLIGHSNGGGFVSQMNTYTKLTNIRAVAFAHSAAAGGGGRSEVCDRNWVTPAFINGSDKDTVVPWSSLVNMFDCLQSKGVPTQLDNDAALQAPGSHHNFLDRSALIAPFWLKY
jgi:hypothetical protein